MSDLTPLELALLSTMRGNPPSVCDYWYVDFDRWKATGEPPMLYAYMRGLVERGLVDHRYYLGLGHAWYPKRGRKREIDRLIKDFKPIDKTTDTIPAESGESPEVEA
ncbi:MAG: hypothetical protein ACOYD4_06760 [Solirubrobacterales bacterium]